MKINRTGMLTSAKLPKLQPRRRRTNAPEGDDNSGLVPTSTVVASAFFGICFSIDEWLGKVFCDGLASTLGSCWLQE